MPVNQVLPLEQMLMIAQLFMGGMDRKDDEA